MFKNLLIAAAAALTAVSSFAASGDLPPNDSIAVEINGVKTPLREVDQKHQTSMYQARSNYYETARRVLEEFVDDYLLEQQAKKENVTVAQLLERHVNSAIAPDPSEETLRVYYETADTAEPYDAVRPKIIEAIRQRRIAKAKTAYMQSLRSAATVAYRLAPPRAPFAVNTAAARGPIGSPVVLTEFADYECPYCQQMQPTLEKLEAEFKDKLSFVYKDFPLPMHANAQKAAEATRCAQTQGKYWEYHDILATTKQLDLPALKAHARQLKLDAAKFDQCLDRGETADVVKAQAAEAQALGLQGTPTFFINGRYISGGLSYERLRGVILEELATADAQRSAPAKQGASLRR
jgi:protein-disulfide isomerase